MSSKSAYEIDFWTIICFAITVMSFILIKKYLEIENSSFKFQYFIELLFWLYIKHKRFMFK